jgi:predicted DsbA family dithiol-disulfide isomerase
MAQAPPPAPVLHIDLVDPISYLLDLELEAVEEEMDVRVLRMGVEVNPPPHPLGTLDEAPWGPRWEEATRIAQRMGIALHRPRLVPWSRKAHELLEHARDKDEAMLPELRRAVMTAFFQDGLDIGRVDVLVELARERGLDRTETKAVLDVDRYGEEIARRRARSVEEGLRVVPTLAVGPHRLEGFHNRASLSTFLSDLLSSS